MAAALLSLTSNKYIILLIMNVILLVSGTFMDVTPAILIFTPLFLPICQSFGMSTIHFGLILVYNLCIGNITPPVGNALFVGIKVGRTSLSRSCRICLCTMWPSSADCCWSPLSRQCLPHCRRQWA